MKLFVRITLSLFVILVLGLAYVVIFSVAYGGVILELTNNSQVTIEHISINYGRGTYLLSKIESGETVKNGVGKIGEGASFEITWKYGGDKVGVANYNVHFNDMLSSTKISIIFPDEKSVLLRYDGRDYKPYLKPGV